MKNESIQIIAQNSTFNVSAQKFDQSDRQIFSKIYKDWRNLSNNLRTIGGRNVNIPEGLSEGLFCLEMGAHRITESAPGLNSSFDAYSTQTNSRIQVKACSVLPDLTSFGPKSVWDRLFFCDFYRQGNWDGTFDIYEIPNHFIYNHNVSSTMTFVQQQQAKRRPRFSIYKDIIQVQNIKPVKTGRAF